MVKRVPAPRPNRTHVIHYVDPATPPAHLVQYTDPDTGYRIFLTPAELVAKQQRDAVLVARWQQRRRLQRERDRKARRFWLGFGAILAVALLAGLVLVAYLIWQALAVGASRLSSRLLDHLPHPGGLMLVGVDGS
ncbi:hypothetical protein AB0M20_10515 [Actinoplanes sp. NPDC051633]|uniref:hypothetical protein n=1 Tax=Actinoplanes sp. NPDC051633 TaxID=3155670 RepID=UPI0034313B59